MERLPNKASGIFVFDNLISYAWDNCIYEVGTSDVRCFDFIENNWIFEYFIFHDSELIIDSSARCFQLINGVLANQIEAVTHTSPYNSRYIMIQKEVGVDIQGFPKATWIFYDLGSKKRLEKPVVEDVLVISSDILLSINRELTAYRPESIDPIWRFDLYGFFESIGDYLMKEALDSPLKFHYIRVLGKWENFLIVEFHRYQLMYLDFETGVLVFLSDNLASRYPEVLAVSNQPDADGLLLDWHLDQEKGKIYSLNANVFVEFDLLIREWRLKKEFPLVIPGSWYFTRSVLFGNKLFFTAQKTDYFSDVLGAFDIERLEVVWFYQFKDSIGSIKVNNKYVIVYGGDYQWYIFTHEEIESEIQKNQNQ